MKLIRLIQSTQKEQQNHKRNKVLTVNEASWKLLTTNKKVMYY